MIHVEVSIPEGIDDKAAKPLAVIALAEALCNQAKTMGMDKDTLLQRISSVINACWDMDDQEPMDQG